MIEIIQAGYDKFGVWCDFCGCHFRYVRHDIQEDRTVRCPDCGHRVKHPDISKIAKTQEWKLQEEKAREETELPYIPPASEDFKQLRKGLQRIK